MIITDQILERLKYKFKRNTKLSPQFVEKNNIALIIQEYEQQKKDIEFILK